MTIKHEIKIDKENKVLTLMVSMPKKKFAKEENISFRDADAWDLVKNTTVEGYKAEYKKNGLIVDNWRICNHEGAYVYPLVEQEMPKVKVKNERSNKKAKFGIKKPAPSKNKE
jgi:hypothetical protein